MTHITPHAKQALETLIDKNRVYKIAKANIEAELKLELIERLASYKSERDLALRLAAEAGVPRTKLGKAIGTSNYRTVQEILEATEQATIQHADLETDSGWSATRTGDLINIEVRNLGMTKVTGWCSAKIVNEDLEFVSGDEFVIPAIYRAGVAYEVING